MAYIWYINVQLYKTMTRCFLKLYQFTLLLSICNSPPTHTWYWVSSISTNLVSIKWYIIVLIFISLINNEVKRLYFYKMSFVHFFFFFENYYCRNYRYIYLPLSVKFYPVALRPTISSEISLTAETYSSKGISDSSSLLPSNILVSSSRFCLSALVFPGLTLPSFPHPLPSCSSPCSPRLCRQSSHPTRTCPGLSHFCSFSCHLVADNFPSLSMEPSSWLSFSI